MPYKPKKTYKPVKPGYWRIGELCQSLDCPEGTIRRLTTDGLIPFCLTAGGHRRYLPSQRDTILRAVQAYTLALHGIPAPPEESTNQPTEEKTTE